MINDMYIKVGVELPLKVHDSKKRASLIDSLGTDIKLVYKLKGRGVVFDISNPPPSLLIINVCFRMWHIKSASTGKGGGGLRLVLDKLLLFNSGTLPSAIRLGQINLRLETSKLKS